MNHIDSDFLIIGGGVTGLSTAYRLAEQGSSVTLVDRSTIGREASWAGAGMLPPGHQLQAKHPECRLRSYSHSLWSQISESLRDETGIDNGYHVCGSLEPADPEHESSLTRLCDQFRQEGIACEHLTEPEQIESLVPDLNSLYRGAVFVPEFAQVRNPWHMQALATACRYRGVKIVENAVALAVTGVGNRVTVCDRNRQFRTDKILIAAGAWSSGLLEHLGIHLPVFPVRGQIVQLKCERLPFRCLIQSKRRYLVPRPDGLVLVGSTEEHCGYDKRTTASAIQDLLAFAVTTVPSLSSASVIRTWAGLRPGSPDELPLLGSVGGFENLFVAAGHFRAGLQMSVGTAFVMADLMLERSPQISLDGLAANRFDSTVTALG